jgi:hypothetical protein
MHLYCLELKASPDRPVGQIPRGTWIPGEFLENITCTLVGLLLL